MKALPAIILASLFLFVPLVAPVGAEDGLPDFSADSVSNGFFALEGVQAEALSDQQMDAIRGGAITFTLTPLGGLPPGVEGVNLNLLAPATGLNDVETTRDLSRFRIIICGNCFIIPG